MTPKEVWQTIKDKEVVMVDLKFIDPVSSLAQVEEFVPNDPE